MDQAARSALKPGSIPGVNDETLFAPKMPWRSTDLLLAVVKRVNLWQLPRKRDSFLPSQEQVDLISQPLLIGDGLWSVGFPHQIHSWT